MVKSHDRSVQIGKEIVHGVTADWDGNWGSEYKAVLQRDPAIGVALHQRNRH